MPSKNWIVILFRSSPGCCQKIARLLVHFLCSLFCLPEPLQLGRPQFDFQCCGHIRTQATHLLAAFPLWRHPNSVLILSPVSRLPPKHTSGPAAGAAGAAGNGGAISRDPGSQCPGPNLKLKPHCCTSNPPDPTPTDLHCRRGKPGVDSIAFGHRS